MGRHRRSAKRAGRPVRTGLLGASAAMAVGAVAVASGLLPGGDTFTVGGESSPGGPVRSDGSAKLQTQGQSGAESTDGAATATPTAPHSPSKSPSPTTKKPSPSSPKPSARTKTPEKTAAPTPGKKAGAPRTEATGESSVPAQRRSPAAPSAEEAMEAEVLALVNEERAKVKGCGPVRFDPALARLAGNFSSDMAKRGFFDHTDPDGDSPWDRAEQAGVKNLGGENIARGQADARAVMKSWMSSEGHRANILNCDYKTLGVGVHLGEGGPWWTQNFGF
ncbi:CAP domain-containing protein [Streptomyces sp. NPDC004838]